MDKFLQIIKKYWLGFIISVLVLISAVMIYDKLHPKTLAKNLIEGTGRIDGDLINLNTKYPGRVDKLFVDDGVKITKNMIIAKIKSKEYEAQQRETESKINALQKEFEAKKIEFEIAKKSIPLSLKKAKSALKSSQESLNELQRAINSQKNVVLQDKRDYKRVQTLFAQKLIQKQLLEKSRLKLITNQDKLKSLKDKNSILQHSIEIARSNLLEAKASQEKIKSLSLQLEAFKENIASLKASKERIEAIIDEMTIRSPIDGFVVEKITNEGEVIGAGMSVATLIDPNSLYLKMFIDTIKNGKIKTGDKAVIFLDAYPDKPIKAKVVNIAQKAEFTPKEVSIRSDRIQRVYAVHIKPLKTEPLLKLGIPAIGVISTDGKNLPKSLDEIPPL